MKKNLLFLTIIFTLIGCQKDNKISENTDLSVQTSSSNLKSEESFITTQDSVKIKYKVSGKGKPCLYIHGGPGQGYSSFEFMKGNELEAELQMIYYDQRGSGGSGKAKNYHIDAMMQDIESLRKHLGLEKFFVLSHSFAGVLATEYTRRFPQHVEGLILANATLHFFNEETTLEQIKFADRLLGQKSSTVPIEKDSLLPMFLNLRQALSKKKMGYRFLTDDVNSVIKMEEIDSLHSRIVDFGTAMITEPEKYPEYYQDYALLTKDIQVPTLVISGSRDYAVGTKHYKTFKFPQQKTALLEGGHLLYFENNRDFVKTVWDFTREN